MDYHVKHATYVDVLAISIKTRIKNIQKNTVFIIENLIQPSPILAVVTPPRRGVRGSTRESVLFIGTQFSNLYTAVDTPAKGRGCCGGLGHG